MSMNVNRILRVPNEAAMGKAHGASLAEYLAPSGARPDSLLRPRMRKFPDVDEGPNLWSPCSNCSSSDENNSPSALNSFDWDKPALEDKSVDFGWSVQDKTDGPFDTSETRQGAPLDVKRPLSCGYVNVRSDGEESKDFKVSTVGLPKSSPKRTCESSQTCEDTKGVSPSTEGSGNPSQRLIDLDSRSSVDSTPESSTAPSYPNEMSESGVSRLQEQEDLRNAAWFQAGIPREIALEVLSGKPEGSFIVRESTTKPGCYALSLRVPPGRNATGIAHYLILHTNRGYKIKGFTKEFATMSALITHHSVMPELLPCPLSLSRNSNRDAEREFAETEHQNCDIFSDIHWLMTDMEL